MPHPTALLPILPDDRPLRLTPTDVSQFVGLEQCERFLRFRLAERAGQDFMEPFGVVPQRMTPLLSLSGHDFEVGIEGLLAGRSRQVHYAARHAQAHNRPENNEEVLGEARSLEPGESVLLFQPRLEAELDGWRLRGDVDLLRLERTSDGTLHALVADMKSTAEVKVEHRLQVAFYGLMIGRIFRDGDVAHEPLQTAILFRPPAEPTPEEEAELGPLRDAARSVFGLDDALLEVVADPDAYAQSVRDLVLGADSTARRIAGTPFDDLPFCLSFKCDGCLYGEFCLKWSAERDDLSLLPYMGGTDKEALRRAGVRSIQALATMKDFAPPTDGVDSEDLAPAPGREALVRRLAATWPVGPRLDELVHRARSFRKVVRKDGTQALGYIPGKGNSSLPVSRPGLNPNLVRIYLDAQHDYLEDRIYLLSALVVACEDGEPVGRRSIIRVTDGPPDSAAKERDLFVAWTRELVQAVVDLAVSGTTPGERKSAPVHIVFFDRHEQRLVLEALARNFPPILRATPPLYDFLTQVAAFDSPVASYLDEEVRTSKNFPMTCQSLHSLATYLKFDWGTPHPFRKLFHARMFDYLGKLDIDGQAEWFTKRSRFASSIPLEYAYAAWGQLPPPRAGKGDEFADFRAVTPEILRAFQGRRLEALEHVASSIPGNPNTEKTPFVLPDLARYEDKAHDLAHALHEFVTIERFVTLADWKKVRHAPPERRVLMGESLLVRYCEADQEPGIAEQNRENERRRLRREGYATAYQEQNPGKKFRLAGKQADECRWSQDGLRFRLRVECEGIDCDLHEALLLSRLRDGEFLVLYPRWAADGRLPEAERTEFTPTPKQMLYGQRAGLVRIEAVKDEEGRITSAFAEVELKESRGSPSTAPYVFSSFSRPLEDGTLYTLDSCPNEWMSFWCKEVAEGLCSGRPHRRKLSDLGWKKWESSYSITGCITTRGGKRSPPMGIMHTAAQTLQQLCGPDLEDLAASTGVIKRRREFAAVTLLRTLVFTALKHRVPKPADFRRTALQFGVDVSKAAIPARFNDELVAFLRAVLDRAIERLLAAGPASCAALRGFTGIYLGDGTTVPLPDDYAAPFPGCGGTAGSGRAALKIQLLWEILSGAVRRLVIEPGKSSDAVSPIAREPVPAGSLMVFDLGYFCLDRFRRLIDAGVSWVSRLQCGVTAYDAAGRELPLLDHLQRCYDAGQRLIDIPIVLGVEHRLRCRLIAVRVPQETAARRRQAAHAKAAKHGRAASPDYLRWQDWAIFVTDCAAERLTWQAVVVLYRTRWQIELMFKIWKSHNGLVAHRPEASPPERLAMVYAKLIGAIVQHWVLLTATWTHADRSLMKAAATLREWINNLAEALDDLEKLADVLERLQEVLRGDRVERRHKKPSHFQLLENPELLEWQI